MQQFFTNKFNSNIGLIGVCTAFHELYPDWRFKSLPIIAIIIDK